MPKIKIFDTAKKSSKYDKYLKDHPYFCNSFRLVLCGPSGCGKTQLLYNLLFSKDFMLDLWKKTKGEINAFIPTLDTCEELAGLAKKNRHNPKNFKIHNKWDAGVCEEEYQKLDEKEANLFIFDDVAFLSNFSTPHKRNIIDEILCAGRHKSAFCVVLSQKYTHLNENLRANNCTCLIMFFGLIQKELERIYTENFSSIMEEKEFNKLIKENLNAPYKFIVFDKKHNKVYNDEFEELNIREEKEEV